MVLNQYSDSAAWTIIIRHHMDRMGPGHASRAPDGPAEATVQLPTGSHVG